jgi:predicted DNA-binding transcriptional regulator YafY
MPRSRSAFLRYQLIDRCLSNRNRLWTWNDLLEAVNDGLDGEGFPPIGKSTLFEDLKDIEYRVYKAPVEKFRRKDRRLAYYRYSDPDFTITKQPLTEGESEHILSIIQLLSRFRGLPQFDWLQEMVPRLQSTLGMVPDAGNVMSFDSNPEYEGYRWIGVFFNAILHRQVLSVQYKDFKKEEPYTREFHPHHLRQYNHRWFVFGKDPEDPRISIVNLALDRVVDVQVVRKRKYMPSQVDWEDHFSDVVGVTKRSVKPSKVTIRIMDREQADYIRTKPLHHTQKKVKIDEESGHYETSITVVPNYELLKLLLSFGGRITVLSPREVVDDMRKHVEQMSGHYIRTVE